jgi:hypothetical protein
MEAEIDALHTQAKDYLDLQILEKQRMDFLLQLQWECSSTNTSSLSFWLPEL